MSRKSLYILQDVKLMLRKFKRPQIGFIGGIIFFLFKKGRQFGTDVQIRT